MSKHFSTNESMTFCLLESFNSVLMTSRKKGHKMEVLFKKLLRKDFLHSSRFPLNLQIIFVRRAIFLSSNLL